MPLISMQDRWSIGIYAGESPFALRSPIAVDNPVLKAGDVTDLSAVFVADPFMIHRDEGWYMFFEVMDAKSKLGKIACARSDDAIDWRYQQVVLSELFHLSYPYVFNFNGDTYMVPETGAAQAVRLYRARAFPAQWEFVCELLTGSPFVDSSLLYNGGC